MGDGGDAFFKELSSLFFADGTNKADVIRIDSNAAASGLIFADAAVLIQCQRHIHLGRQSTLRFLQNFEGILDRVREWDLL